MDHPRAAVDECGLGALERRPWFAELTSVQRRAATAQGNVLVTAGAGSGKTKTLVARYVVLLARGYGPRQILAVTFTEKAAHEMRCRVRLAVADLASALDTAEGRRWLELEGTLDAARIGTIHSFCAELLRSHPAEAAVDPRFAVVDEAAAAALKAEAVEAALAWAATDPEMIPLFDSFRDTGLHALLSYLLQRRADVGERLQATGDAAVWHAYVLRELGNFASKPVVRQAIAELRAQAQSTSGHEAWLNELLAAWETFASALAAGEALRAAASLQGLQQAGLDRAGRCRNAPPALAALRSAYEATVAAWLNEREGRCAVDPAVEERFVTDAARLARLFAIAERVYQDALSSRQGLDFDDLETGAVRLLQRPEVRQRWQAELRAVLVDEFQDTNARQAAILDALVDNGGNQLFVVGDALQSIYRFRGADVTVFRETEKRFRQAQWTTVDLDQSFRTHATLLESLDAVLGPLFVVPPDGPAYCVSYQRLTAAREVAPATQTPPYLELCIGVGPNATAARGVAAGLLAQRLRELHASGQIATWEDVALLFRAASGFAPYERALEDAAIPFVTVASIGFFARPEVRDVLNMLVAIAEPWNDLALAGLLRSPAFGVSDAGLYRLRCANGQLRPFQRAIADPPPDLHPRDAACVARAHRILNSLQPLADRLPVADLLTRLLEATSYRAVLASYGRSRLWRNLDKLLDDARASGLVQIREFIDYLDTLRKIEVRESEALVEPSGAVRLMTVHKAKGLEFPVVVIGDAGYAGPSRREPAYLARQAGVAAVPNRRQQPLTPLAVRLAQHQDRLETDAESRRLLYVAATRARDRLLVSGHLTVGSRRPAASGWLGWILQSLGLEASMLTEPSFAAEWEARCGRGKIGLRVAAEEQAFPAPAAAPPEPPPSACPGVMLYQPIVIQAARGSPHEVDQDVSPTGGWPAHRGDDALSELVGTLVHLGLAHWLFPPDPLLDQLLAAAPRDKLWLREEQRRTAVAQAKRLLTRFRKSPAWATIDAAGRENRFAELPYLLPASPAYGAELGGRIDLLYRDATGWHLVDFKTDHLPDEAAMWRAIRQRGYQDQLARYLKAAQQLAKLTPDVWLCFLDVGGEVRMVRP